MSVTWGRLGAALLVLAAGTAVRAQSSPPLSTPSPGVAKPGVVTATALPLENKPAATVVSPAASANTAPPSAAPLNPYRFDGTAGPSMTDAFPVGPKPQTTEGYLAYEQPGCCGPLGANGPIGSEIYFRTGPAFLAGNSTLAESLNTGVRADLGSRTLLFDPAGTSAWVVDVGIVYIYNDGNGSRIVTTLVPTGAQIVTPQNPSLEIRRATVRDLNRWAASLALGRDWFVTAPGFVTWGSPCTIAYGIDAGGRWGTSHVGLNVTNPNNPTQDFNRHHDVFGVAFIGAHVDYEMPMGGWTLVLGGRLEWAYNWIGVLDNFSNNFHDISLLLTTGVRY